MHDAQVFKLKDIIRSPNLAEKLGKHELDELGRWVVENYKRDLYSRSEWEQRNEKGIKLALQVVEQKAFPWTNCSNVKFPLLTIAALQFLARISILTKGRKPVKFEAIGADPEGKKGQQAARLSTHMSMQLTDDDKNWVDDDEKTKLATSIVGSGFKKTHYDSVQGVNISEYVPAMNFVVDYYCKHLDTATRMTHLLSMSENKIQERVRRGLFLEMHNDSMQHVTDTTNLLKIAADEAEGIKRPAEAEEYEILEQHCWKDFDGDGYAEPYIMYVRRDTGQVLRIVARFFDEGDVHRVMDGAVRELENQIRETEDMKERSRLEKMVQRLENADDNHVVRIDAHKYFTKYTFIPSPDGGFYGLGFGSLLGPMNASVDTLVNQLIDAGTMSNSGGGFLGRGVKLKGGKTSFDPFEWKPVDSTGDDLRKNIFPLPVREPSAVLFNLLGMLIQYGEKISGATDIMTGVNPGQNTPAETSRNTVEQGMMLFSGIYARMYRSFRDELSKMYELNRLHLRDSPRFWELTKGPNALIAADDYTTNRFNIFPAADASSVSASQRKAKADQLVAFASSPLGAMLDKAVITRAWLEAHEYDNIEQIFPDPKGQNAVQPPANPKIELEKAKLQQSQQQHQDNMQLAVAQLQSEAGLSQAKIVELQAKATKEMSEAQGVDTGHQIAMIEAQIGAAKAKQEGILGALQSLQKTHELQLKGHQQMHQQTIDKMAAQGKPEPQPQQGQQPQPQGQPEGGM
jgi:chaperonin GroES